MEKVTKLFKSAMNNKLVVVTDLGSFKAYKLETNSQYSTPRLELVEEFNLVDAHGKIIDHLTDLAGRYHAPVLGKWATPWGERHNIELERKRRLVKQVVHALADLLHRNGADSCYLAAGKEINHQIMAELPRDARAKIEKIVACDLTKANKTEILRHFEIFKVKPAEAPVWQNAPQARRGGSLRQQL